MAADTVNGIPRVDLQERPLWKRSLGWALGDAGCIVEPDRSSGAADTTSRRWPGRSPLITAVRPVTRLITLWSLGDSNS